MKAGWRQFLCFCFGIAFWLLGLAMLSVPLAFLFCGLIFIVLSIYGDWDR